MPVPVFVSIVLIPLEPGATLQRIHNIQYMTIVYRKFADADPPQSTS